MTNLTPEQRAEMVAFIREGATVNRERSNSKTGWFTPADKQRFALKADALQAAADALEAFPGLAEQNRKMREALEIIHRIQCSPEVQRIYTIAALHGEPYRGETWEKVMYDARHLAPTEAEQQARENAEKAALLDEAHKHLVFALTLIRQCCTPANPDWQADYATLLAFVFDLGEELKDEAAKEAADV